MDINTIPDYPLILMGCSHMCINPLKVSLDCRVQELDLLPQPLGLLMQLSSLLLHLADVLGSLLQRGGFADLCQQTGASLHVSSTPESFTHIQFYSIINVKRLPWLNVIWFCSSTVQKPLFGDALCPPPPFRTRISNAAAYLYTVPLCLAGSSVLSQDYVKCRNPV